LVTTLVVMLDLLSVPDLFAADAPQDRGAVGIAAGMLGGVVGVVRSGAMLVPSAALVPCA
jgi:hypothetical protein